MCTDTYGSLPSTQLSCGLDVMWKALPGRRSTRSPPSYTTTPCPDSTTPVWGAWHSAVPTEGALCSDHFQPGWYVARPSLTPATSTISKRPCENSRTSSGLLNSFRIVGDIGVPRLRL